MSHISPRRVHAEDCSRPHGHDRQLLYAAPGVFVSKNDSSYYFSRGGASEGFKCYYVGGVISGNGMVIMTNSDNGSLSTEVANSVATVYELKDYYKPVLKTVVDVDEAVLESYVGKYEAGGDVFAVKREGRKVLISPYPGFWVNVYFTSDTDFFVMEFKGNLKFVVDAKGKVAGFNIDWRNGYPRSRINAGADQWEEK
ncbi:MAG: hypothetical protein WAV93_13635 [Bacteroidales bacterium]